MNELIGNSSSQDLCYNYYLQFFAFFVMNFIIFFLLLGIIIIYRFHLRNSSFDQRYRNCEGKRRVLGEDNFVKNTLCLYHGNDR